jgi:transcriptional regulator with XRE-family HTH domain
LIRRCLKQHGLEQRDLAATAQATESYISQLPAWKKEPPAPGRTGIYEKIARVLRLQSSDLSNLAGPQRKEEVREKVAQPSAAFIQRAPGINSAQMQYRPAKGVAQSV